MNKARRPGIDPEQVPSPCYVLEEQLLINNLETLQYVARESGAEILCALKGFAMWSTFPLIKQYLSGATASSLNEARLCYELLGVKAHLCAPVYLDREFDEIGEISSHITFNSLTQFQRFKDRAMAKGMEMAIRINPEFSEVGTEMYNPCTPGSRLGETADKFGEHLPEGVTGLHFHALCEQNADTLARVLTIVENKFGHVLGKIRWINFGGGHHITRRDYDIPLLIETIRAFRKKYNVDVILEPGEAVGWQTGYLVTTVEDIIESGGIKTVMLDASFSAHMPDCLEMPYKPKIWRALPGDTGKHIYRMGGHTCLAGDFVGNYAFEQPLQPGDKLVFDDMIHYTMVKTTFFNGVNHPAIGIWKKDNSFELVKTFGYDDYKNKLS